MKGVAEKVAVVTGGASGIGRALCEELARQQAVVIVADLNAGEADRVAQALTDGGGRASAAAVDVASAESVQQLVRTTLARHGRIDLMFSNAGVAWGGDFQGMAPADLDRMVGINLNGVLYGASAVYPTMVKQGTGHIVNMAALTGLLPGPGSTIYAATKHAVVGFSQSLRGEAQAFGVRVSVVCPGFVNTNLTRNSESIQKGQVDSHPPPMRSQRLEAPTCARAILHGVSRNRAIIVVPLYARLAWWLFRASPTLYHATVRPLVMSKMRPGQTSRLAIMCSSTARWMARSLMRLR